MTESPNTGPSGQTSESPAAGQRPVDPLRMQPSPPPPPPPGYAPVYAASAGPSKSGGILTRVLTGLLSTLLLLSLLLNFYLGAYFASTMRGPTETVHLPGDRAQRIVILPIQGMIDDTTARFMFQALRSLAEDQPKAIVLRVDSGGGAVAASDRVWHMIKQFKAEHQVPIVASFGGLAASGGYYVAALSDYIVSEPTTITGSIGVIAQAFTMRELFEKIGVRPEIIAASEANSKDVLSPFRDWTDRDRQKLQTILDSAHERFVQVVHEGRQDHLTQEQVRQLATGEPLTAQQALAGQLIDEEGYLDQAIAKAAELAGIGLDVQPHVTVINPIRPWSVLGGIMGRSNPGSVNAEQLRRWLAEMTVPALEYRLSY